MLKKIPIKQLGLGMYIHELHCSWMDHPFVRNQFKLTKLEDLQTIKKVKIQWVTIDTEKGLDVQVMASEETPLKTEPKQKKIKPVITADIDQRFDYSKKIINKASQVAKKILNDVSAGKKVDMDATENTVSSIIKVISNDAHTLLGVSRIKTKDEYTFQHSVSVCALMTAFAQFLGFSEQDVDEISTGGLLHDIGKALTPNHILNKPGKLTDEEFVVMRGHAIKKSSYLLEDLNLTDLALDVITMHHERPDGRGYPSGLKDKQLSQVGKMSAIVDIYDALTSVRVYKSAWEPSEALKHMLSWCPHQLDLELTQKFIKMLGVYPVGSLVLLKSGMIGIVIEPGEQLLKPKIKIIFNSKSMNYVPVKIMDLRKFPNESIQSPVSPKKYKIEMGKFL